MLRGSTPIPDRRLKRFDRVRREASAKEEASGRRPERGALSIDGPGAAQARGAGFLRDFRRPAFA